MSIEAAPAENKVNYNPLGKPLVAAQSFLSRLRARIMETPAEIERREVRKQLRDDLRFLRTTYGLSVRMGRYALPDQPYAARLEKLGIQEAHIAIKIIIEELAKYHPWYIRDCRIRRLRLSKSLCLPDKESSEGSIPVGGAACPDHTLYVASCNSHSALKRHLHHELFHRADQREAEILANFPAFGNVLARDQRRKRDSEWARLNPQGKNAYSRISYAQFLSTVDADNCKPGFARAYGTINEHEDRATVAELLMVQPLYAQQWAEHDEVLRDKIARIKQLFYQRSGGRMDQAWYQELISSSNL